MWGLESTQLVIRPSITKESILHMQGANLPAQLQPAARFVEDLRQLSVDLHNVVGPTSQGNQSVFGYRLQRIGPSWTVLLDCSRFQLEL
jgi:hypothetical protein